MKSKVDALNIGIKPEILNLLTAVFKTYEAIETVVLYGSRAKGTYHAGSDIDITLTGEKLNDSMIGRIEDDIDNLPLPYSFDISLWSQIDNADLRAHIERV
jgi:uncharacterized protein